MTVIAQRRKPANLNGTAGRTYFGIRGGRQVRVAHCPEISSRHSHFETATQQPRNLGHFPGPKVYELVGSGKREIAMPID